MVNQISGYNSAFAQDAMKYLQHMAVVEHKDNLFEDIQSSLSMAPLIAIPSAIGAKNSYKISKLGQVPDKVKFTDKVKNIPKAISEIPKNITEVPKAAGDIFSSLGKKETWSGAINTAKNTDAILALSDVNNEIKSAAKSLKKAKDAADIKKYQGIIDTLTAQKKNLEGAIETAQKTGAKVSDDIIKGADDAISALKSTGKTGFLSKIGKYVKAPFSWLGGKITGSSAYNTVKSSKLGGKALSKLGNFAKYAKKGGAIFDLAIEGTMQIFTEIIPAFKNGGFDSGIKQIGKSGAQVGASVGGWALGAKAGTAVGAAIGSIFPGAGTVIGGAIGGIVGGLLGSSVLTGIAKKITGKSENEILQEEQLEQQAQMASQDSATMQQLQSAVAQQVQYDIASGTANEDTQRMMEYLNTMPQSSNVSFGGLTSTGATADSTASTTANTGYTATSDTTNLIATNPDGSYNFTVPPEAFATQYAMPTNASSNIQNPYQDPILA